MSRPLNRIGWILAAALALFMIATFAGVVRGGPLDPSGAPAPTMKTLHDVEPRMAIASLPFTVSVSGSYYLTANLTLGGAGNGITIDADEVTLDLNGFAVVGNPSAGSAITGVTPHDNWTIRNGSIRGWPTTGIDGSSALRLLVEHVMVSGSNRGIVAGATGIVRDVQVSSPAGATGISLGSFSQLDRCIVRGSGANTTGIAIGDDSTVTSCSVSGNSIGIVSGTNTRISDCVATGFLVVGIEAGPSSSISSCSLNATNTGVLGLRLFAGAVATNNRIEISGNNSRCIMLAGAQATIRQNDMYTCPFAIANTGPAAGSNTIYQNTYHGLGNMIALLGGNDIGPSPSFAGSATSPWANIGP